MIDDELDELIEALPAIALEGPKGVGKTRTARERASTILRLDDPAELGLVRADPQRALQGARPVLIDEWQHAPEVWDIVRRAVDDGAPPGAFILAGSATPDPPPTHSGAGRIVSLRMRPLTLSERRGNTTVSLGSLLSGDSRPVTGATEMRLAGYVEEIVSSGFPGLRSLPDRPRRAQLGGYVDRVVDRDISDEAGITIRSPAALRRWMAAYAAASSTSTSFEKLRDAASSGEERKRSRDATRAYRDALARVWITDEVPAWLPTHNRLSELAHAPKHQLADPALAAQLLGVQSETLLAGRSPEPAISRDGSLLGALFESLAALCVRVYASHNEARLAHFRTTRGRHEVDLIVERADGGIVAIEVKLAQTVDDHDVRHLAWLHDRIGERMLDRVVVTTGAHAYRRPDGVAVVPLALLGP